MTAYAEVIGDSAGRSQCALIQSYWLHKCGLRREYRVRFVAAGDWRGGSIKLKDYFARGRDDAHWLGCNVRASLMHVAAALVDRKDAIAERLGLVDLVVKDSGSLLGWNSAAWAFMRPVMSYLERIPSRAALVIGSGCAARTIAHALAGIGFRLEICSRTIERATSLVEELGQKNGHRASTFGERDGRRGGFGLLVNASPLGSGGLPSPADMLASLAQGAVVCDIVFDPVETQLLKSAVQLGFVTINGLELIIGRAAISFEALFGVRAPRAFDAQLESLLVQ